MFQGLGNKKPAEETAGLGYSRMRQYFSAISTNSPGRRRIAMMVMEGLRMQQHGKHEYSK
jgi:hypothetical protein